MDQQGQPRWRPTRRQLLWAGATAGLLLAILIGYRYEITLWDWLKLLIVPAVIAGGGLWFNTQQREREQRIAHNRAQDESLQAYLDGMSQLLTDRDQPLHKAQPGDSLRAVARARTLTVLGRLDGSRKRSVLQFLYESGLIYKERTLLNESDLIERQHNIVSLRRADLRAANLRAANLSLAYLSLAYLMEANLRAAYLIEANLRWANLSGADLTLANLSEADLSRALLNGADLSKADLSKADLSEADLRGARGWAEDQLSEARTLAGATMPDGQILQGDEVPDGPTFAEWLKDRERRGEAE